MPPLWRAGPQREEPQNPATADQHSTRELPPATGLPISEDDVMAAMMAVFERAGTPPHIVYAAQKTGRIVTVENQYLLSDDELAEWNAAVEECRQQRRVRRRWKR